MSTVQQVTTTTKTTTSTTTVTATATVQGPNFNFVQFNNNHCVPFNYQTFENTQNYPNYNAAFQACAKRCQGIQARTQSTSLTGLDLGPSLCIQIYVGWYTQPPGAGDYDCLT